MQFFGKRDFKHSSLKGNPKGIYKSNYKSNYEKKEKRLFSLLILFLGLFAISFALKEEPAEWVIPVSFQKPLPVVDLVSGVNEASALSLLPRRFRVKLQKGEDLTKLFTRLQLDIKEVNKLVRSVSARERRKLNRLPRNNLLYITLHSDNSLKELIVMEGPIRGTSYLNYGEGKYRSAAYAAEYSKQHRYLGGEIESSLYRDGLNIGMTDALVIRFAEIFAYDIDFANDVRKGDTFSMLLEDLLVDNQTVQQDIITLVKFVNRGKDITAIRYTNNAGETGYFTPNGESMKTRFLRMPVKFSRISSRFNLKRRHPILNRVRPHRGTDFAARRGTPINSAGNGVISHVGYKSGYGKTIIINHGSGYKTLYAHMHGYARGMSRGKRIKQGDVIGYVGSTGLSTAPHLHYEFRINGVHHNPLTVRLPRNAKLQKSELQRFRRYAKGVIAEYGQRELDWQEGDTAQLTGDGI